MNKDIKNIYDMIQTILITRKNELANKQEHFKVFVECEITTSCFEANAISELLSIHELKAEIKDLEHWEKLLRTAYKVG
jgi:hypothetical protein